MTREEAMALINTLGEDVEAFVTSDGNIEVTVIDFLGFDESWGEIERELDDAEAVLKVHTKIRALAHSATENVYSYYEFDDFTICWGYASADI